AATAWRRLARCAQERRPGPRVQVSVDRLPAGLHMEFTPLRRAEADEAGAGQMRSRFVDLIRRCRGIRLQDVLCFVAIEALDRGGEVLGRRFSLAEHGPW